MFRDEPFGRGPGPIFLSRLYCSGTENTLLECKFRTIHSCSHENDVSVECIGKFSLVKIVHFLCLLH